MQQAVRHSWVLCSPIGLFRRPQAGITIGPDDRWAYLAWSGVQVDFVSDLALTIIAAPPIISNDPRIMLINNNGVETYTYAAVP